MKICICLPNYNSLDIFLILSLVNAKDVTVLWILFASMRVSISSSNCNSCLFSSGMNKREGTAGENEIQ